MRLNDYLSKFAELKALYEIVRNDFSNRGLVHHNWNHILRDLARGVIIGETEGANMKVVLASVLLHDIGRLYSAKGKDHHASGVEVATKYLKNSGFTKRGTEEIIHCIRSHGQRGLEEPKTLEANVVYDVNVLSCACRNVGVARVFHYFIAEEKFTIKKMMKIGSGRKGPRKNFYTETGRKLGEEGFAKAAKFWRELDEELKEEEQSIKEIIPEYKGD
ncbi:MAG: HD domain-containing protein [Candidatus Bathyarchaeota archaeon]|nr:HD domain-containing protein [Candidatus Bathyarchaeota archaeon]MDH5494571.1 HD domain-containing protein [Candidatus Bathyarchaeota archaeon]